MATHSFSIKGNLVDIFKKEIYPAEIVVVEGKIDSINPIIGSDLIINYQPITTSSLVLLIVMCILKAVC